MLIEFVYWQANGLCEFSHCPTKEECACAHRRADKIAAQPVLGAGLRSSHDINTSLPLCLKFADSHQASSECKWGTAVSLEIPEMAKANCLLLRNLFIFFNLLFAVSYLWESYLNNLKVFLTVGPVSQLVRYKKKSWKCKHRLWGLRDFIIGLRWHPRNVVFITFFRLRVLSCSFWRYWFTSTWTPTR